MNTMDIVNEFSKLRLQKYLTIREAAVWLGISASHLSDVESQRKTPSPKLVNKMVSFFLVEEKRTRKRTN